MYILRQYSHYILNLFKHFNVFSCSNIRENTIASMKDAVLHGADMVEFDVQVNITVQYITVHIFSSANCTVLYFCNVTPLTLHILKKINLFS